MTISPEQHALLQERLSWVNFISCGWQAGSTTMALECLLRARGAATRGLNSLYVTSDKDRLDWDRSQIIRLLSFADEDKEGLLFPRRPTGSRIEVFSLLNAHNGMSQRPVGSITLVSADNPNLDVIGPFDQIVIDNAHRIPGFSQLWENEIVPLKDAFKWVVDEKGNRVSIEDNPSLKDQVRRRCMIFVFGRASGVENGFGRLCLEKANERSHRHVCIPTSANPTAPDVMPLQAKVSDAEWRQEYLGEIVQERVEISHGMAIIKDGETFLQWCDRLSSDGLKVDGHPFRLDDRPTMRWIYEQIPSTIEEAYKKRLTIMKCAQVGFTVFEMLASIYLALKFMPAKIGMYLPVKDLATMKSSERFMPIVRTIPDAHKLMLDGPSGTRKTGEGNVLIRNMGGSRYHFLWTSGKATTESVPLDILSFDEVQEMSIADMEKTAERLSASRIRYTLMGSTANWPDRDIHFFYKKGTQHQFWTLCTSCGTYQVLDNHFPECIRKREGEWSYVCHHCDKVIVDSQVGEWRPLNPDADNVSIHYPQFLSPTISPKEIIEAYRNADDMKNFYNRKLGKPYLDPTQVPVDLEMLNDCARIGMEMGVVWKDRARDTFMGIDQMGLFNVAIICERLPSGHMAVIHVEEIYDDDPFLRCSDLMGLYGVSVCVVESLPNYNDSKRFAGRHEGRVFLASYTEMKDDMMRWGDATLSKTDRRTSEEDRDRYTVTLDQYKCMQVAMKRISNRVCVFPDPDGLVQTIKDKGVEQLSAVLKERVFEHFTHTALVAEMDEEERKYRRRVVKVGMDPHFSYAFMLLNVAWARNHGTTMFLNPPEPDKPNDLAENVGGQMPGLPQGVLKMIDIPKGTCGRCQSFASGQCLERGLLVAAKDPGCDFYIENIDHDQP